MVGRTAADCTAVGHTECYCVCVCGCGCCGCGTCKSKFVRSGLSTGFFTKTLGIYLGTGFKKGKILLNIVIY